MPRHDDDLDWLYRNEVEHTKVLPPDQIALSLIHI